MEKKRPETERTHEELLPCVAYLHGTVVGGQFRAACQYEYARESNVLRRAAELRSSADPVEVSFKIEEEFHCGSWFMQPEWSFLWECPSFPAKSWNGRTELSYRPRSLPNQYSPYPSWMKPSLTI
jgi:hypothetical protein